MGKTYEIHGMHKTPTYNSWTCMKGRCDNESNKDYYNYGGRGISYDPKWKTFKGFIEDMGIRPENMTLDRIDNNAGYTKENCRWVDNKTQSNNRRNTLNITFNGKTQTLKDWSVELGFQYTTLYRRLTKYGWSVERTLTEPLKIT